MLSLKISFLAALIAFLLGMIFRMLGREFTAGETIIIYFVLMFGLLSKKEG